MLSSEQSEAGGFAWSLLLSALVALAVGPLDALLNFLTTRLGDALPEPTRVAITLGAGLVLTVCCFTVLLGALLSLSPICRLCRWPYRRISLLLAAAPFAVLLRSSIGSAERLGFGGPAARTAYIGVVALTIAVLLYLAARGVDNHSAIAKGLAWSLPAFSFGALALVHQQMLWRARPLGPLWDSAATFTAPFLWVVILGGAIAAYRAKWLTTRRAATWTAVSGVVVAGALGFLAMPARSHGSQQTVGSADGQRNVIVISIDTLRADRLGSYGAGPTATPSIDRLAADGRVFENAYSPAPWTLPGVAAFMTGMNPAANGTDCRLGSCSLSDNVVTLGERFHDAGYRTAAFGANTHIVGRNLLQGIGEYRFGPFVMLPRNSPGSIFLWRTMPDWFGEDWTTAEIADSAIAWVQQNKDARFFLWVHFLDPHVPYSAPPRNPKAHPNAEMLMRRSEQLATLVRKGEVFPQNWIQTIQALYESETAVVDSNVGRLLDRLRELDLYDDAVILLISDHGEELWDHGGYEHGHTLYDELLRVPLIIKAPSVSPGRTVARVGATQATRTALQAAGLDAEDAYLAPALPASDPASDATLLIGGTLYFGRRTGIIFDDLKYIRNLDDGSELLFDLAADPKEQHPLTDEPSLDAARHLLDERLQSSMELRDLFVDDTQAPANIPPDLLRSLGYL